MSFPNWNYDGPSIIHSKKNFQDASQVAKNYLNNLIRKVSWQRIGHSASNIFHQQDHQIEMNQKYHRKITPHILFPIEIQEIIVSNTG